MGESKYVSIPKWFIQLVKYTLPAFLAWSGWVSMNIHEMSVNQKVIIEQLKKMAIQD